MWRTSSHSDTGACVEADSWRTSTASNSGACVEVGQGVKVRDSQDRGGGLLELTPAAWTAFTARLKAGT